MDIDTTIHLPLEPFYICEQTKQGIKLIKIKTGEACCTKNVKVCCTSPDTETKHEVPVVKRGRGRPIMTEPIYVTQVPSKADAELVGISGKELTELKKQRKTELNNIASRKARKKRNARLSKIHPEGAQDILCKTHESSIYCEGCQCTETLVCPLCIEDGDEPRLIIDI